MTILSADAIPAVRIAVTGGIGAGKSTVCRMLRAMGHPVYDSDLRARAIMEGSSLVRRWLREEIHPDCAPDARPIDRPLVAKIVFNDPEKLRKLNSMVHALVREDFSRWCGTLSRRPLLFLETALLHQSGMDALVDAEWRVTAPREVRLLRVMRRNGLSRADVMQRIEAQETFTPPPGLPVEEITNDGRPLLPQVARLVAARIINPI